MRILIADDETLARKALRHIIETSGCELEVVGEAKNAQEAFEEYKKHLPDIVITDICMTGTDGLDLIENIRGFDSSAKIIVLSAYDKFDYAKRAYESGAAYYLLKPIDANEVISKLLDIRESLTPNVDKDVVNTNILSLKEKYFKDIFIHPFNEIDSFEESCKSFGITCSDKFVVAKVYPNGFYKLPEKTQKIATLALYETMKYFSGIYVRESAVISMSECEWVMVCFFAETVTDEQIHIHMNELFMSFQEQFEIMANKINISVGVSGIYNDVKYMRTAYDEACEMILSTAWIGKGSIVSKESEAGTNQRVFMTKAETEQICDACINQNEVEAIHYVNKYFQRIRGLDYVEFVNLCNAVAVAIINISNNTLREEMIYKIFDRRSNMFLEVTQCGDVYGMNEWFQNKISIIMEYVNRKDKKTKISDVLDIIEKDYAQVLTAEMVAAQIHFSASYMLRLFKMEMGKPFHTYLTEYRIKKAVELLEGGDIKVSEVSEKVGYSDPNYFGQIFKRIMGVTPQKYLKELK